MTLFPRVSGTDPYNFMIMNTANEIGHLSTVAMAVYYCCVACPASFVPNGYKFDGTRCTLSFPNQRYCFIGQRYIAEAQRELSVLLANDRDECSTGPILRSLCDSRGPFMAWQESLTDDLCTSCRSDIGRQYKETRTRLWKDFPIRLGLGSWDDLNQDVEI